MSLPLEPTCEQIKANSLIVWLDEYGKKLSGYACWYPQMGGYIAKCVIHPHKNGCFDAYIWHDGVFPFNGEDEPGRNPVMIHHCMAEQFIEFGEFAEKMCDEAQT